MPFVRWDIKLWPRVMHTGQSRGTCLRCGHTKPCIIHVFCDIQIKRLYTSHSSLCHIRIHFSHLFPIIQYILEFFFICRKRSHVVVAFCRSGPRRILCCLHFKGLFLHQKICKQANYSNVENSFLLKLIDSPETVNCSARTNNCIFICSTLK